MKNHHHHHHHHHHLHLLHLNLHLHLPHFHHRAKPDTPKGCFVILVGEEQERFVVPVVYVNHPLFVELLKAAEEEYGFDQKGPISIPCPVEEFLALQGVIHHDRSAHHLPISCFKHS